MKFKILKTGLPLLTLSAAMLLASCKNAEPKKEASLDEIVLNSKYFLNDTIQVPSMKVDCDGVMVDGSCYIKTPSGEVKEVKDSFVASEFGKYEVIYSATYGGKTYTRSQSFSTAKRATDLFTLSSGNLDDASIKQEKFMFDSNYLGVKATVSAGGSVSFNQIIDFNKITMDAPLFSMLIEPHCATGSDFSLLEFVFTDVDDPSNKMTIIYSAGDGYGYIRAGGKGQVEKGWQNYNNTLTSKCHVGSFGNPLFTSFEKEGCQNASVTYPLNVFYENNQNQLFAASTRCFPWGSKPSFVVDFDDIRSQGDNIWHGFTNGKAKLTVTPKQTSSSNATLLFMSIAGYDLTKEEFIDEEKPTISFSDIVSSGVAPQAKVGEVYNLFDCKASDSFDGNLNVTKNVKYINPVNHSRSDVEVINDTFTPLIPGVYELIYSAKDSSGNEETTIFEVVASNNITPITLEVNDEDRSEEIFKEISVLPASNVTVKGGSGDCKVIRTIYGPNGRVINTDGNIISLEDVGVYKVVYEAIDYLGHYGSKIIKITSNNRAKPKIMGSLSFPDALLKGFTYDIPTLEAKECVDSGVISYDATVFISVDDGEEKVCNDSSFVAEGNTMTITYLAKGRSGQEERISQTYEVRDGENGKKQDRYFYCKESNVVLEKEYVEYSTNSANNSASFINKLNSKSFAIEFNYNFSNLNADGFKIKLEDESRTHSFTMDAVISKTDVKMTYPGCLAPVSVATQFSDGVYKVLLSYNSVSGIVSDIDSNDLCVITREDSGKAFGGFGGYIYASMSIINPNTETGSKVFLTKLSNQPLGYRAKSIERAEDIIDPEIYLDYEFDRKQIIGSTFVVPKALSCDVLNPIVKFTVDMYSRTETGAVKEYVFQNEDASVEHSVKLTTYDNFIIRYNSVDMAGNEVVATRLLYVIENEPPLLSADYSNIKNVYRLGDGVSLPNYSVSDNSGHYEVNIYVMDPNARLYLLAIDNDGVFTSLLNSDKALYSRNFYIDEKTWKPSLPGEYKYKIVAKDNCFNYSSSEHVFYVTNN